MAACWCVGQNRSGEWGWSLRKNRRIIGPIEPWGQIAQICSRTLFAWRVRRTSSRVMVSEVTVPPPILVNFLFSASCRHLTAAAVYVDMSIESGLEEGSGEWSMVMSAPQTLNGLGGSDSATHNCLFRVFSSTIRNQNNK